MNWKIGFMMWWKGLVVMTVPCMLLFLVGIWVLIVALLISWPAIFLYAAWLWVCKQSNLSHTATLASTILVAAPASIALAMWLFHHFIDETTAYHFSIYSFDFLGPLLCCILGVFLSGKSVYLYLNPGEAITAFTID